jgi:UDP:flavonoid glycosyltransferase YjiC (YdhE family)
MFADQPTNARLVEQAGAGIAVVAGTESAANNTRELALQHDAIRGAVLRVLGTPSFAHAARALASEMATAPSARDVCELLAEDM